MNDDFGEIRDDELDQLGNFLLDRIDENADCEGKDEGILDVTELDGFLTAVVSGPVMIPPSQWLPAVWGDFEPVWESDKAFEEIFALMIRIMNSNVVTLMEYTDDFEPLFYEREVKGKTYTIVDEWCEGYMRGVGLALDLWKTGGLEMEILLAPIKGFTSVSGWMAHDKKLSEVEVDNIRNAITPNARDIHAFWLARREDTSPAGTTFHRGAPRIGRNDPCPCGSGKKYKKCCLH